MEHTDAHRVGAEAAEAGHVAVEAVLKQAVDVDRGQAVGPLGTVRWARDALGQRTAVGDGVRVDAADRSQWCRLLANHRGVARRLLTFDAHDVHGNAPPPPPPPPPPPLPRLPRLPRLPSSPQALQQR